jgi:HK97 family phage major capsid protein
MERMYQTGKILSRATRTPIGPNSNGMVFNGIDETSRVDGSRYGGLLGYWLNEGGTKTASQPKFRQVELKLHKVACLAYATDELLQDATALESWLARTVPEELKFRVEDAIYNGDGVGKPYGIMSSTAMVTVTRDTASKILLADIAGMWARRWAGVDDYVWFVNQDTMPQLLALANSTINSWMPDLRGGVPMTLLGKPVIEIEQAASLNTTGDIMLAAMSQYQVIDKGGVQAASSIHVAFLTDQSVFRFVYRVDGAPLWSSALTPFKGSSTQSPFVVLGSASA